MATLMPAEGQSRRPLRALEPERAIEKKVGKPAPVKKALSQSNIGGLSLERPGWKTRRLLFGRQNDATIGRTIDTSHATGQHDKYAP